MVAVCCAADGRIEDKSWSKAGFGSISAGYRMKEWRLERVTGTNENKQRLGTADKSFFLFPCGKFRAYCALCII